MKGKLAAVIGTASLFAAVAAVPASADPSPTGPSCLGYAVSVSAHQAQQQFGVGFGAYFHQLGENVGTVIQAYEATVCDA